MKKMMCVAAIITVFMLILPLAVLGEGKYVDVKEGEPQSVPTIAPTSKEESFSILFKESNKIEKISAEDYIFGVVAAEMPALYDIEALKAQAVAAYTYALYKKEQNKAEDYDITSDFNTDQCYKSKEQALKDWGEGGEEYFTKIEKAVNEVKGQYLTYDNKPILAVYHALSSGQTYSAKEVWGKEIPYLKAASSEEDRLAENFTDTVSFSLDELKEKLNVKEASIDKTERSDSGIVKLVVIGGKEITGVDIRTALSLKSCNFKITQDGETVEFTTYGYGHGVGMSQRGADNMAKTGWDYKAILKHYYKGAVLTE